jgi:hypothetical protein
MLVDRKEFSLRTRQRDTWNPMMLPETFVNGTGNSLSIIISNIGNEDLVLHGFWLHGGALTTPTLAIFDLRMQPV